ncbi:MAG: MATE family efflux transporter [Clostridia bacterium]|nr:MATE family efflux transporter [Clostridia bacterium]
MNEKSIEKVNPLGTESVGKLVAEFAGPSVISLVVNALYNIVDQVFIGQGVGYLGNAATNVIVSFTIICSALALLIGDGAVSYMSLKLGQKDPNGAAKGVGNAVVMTTGIGIVLCVVLQIFLEPLCVLFGATESVLPYAEDYGRIICFGVFFAAIDSAMAGLIRADGSPGYSMAGLLAGCAANIILDPLFIFVFQWGVKGAAWATIIGQILNAVIYIAYIFRFKTISLNRKSFVPSFKRICKICSLGTSSFITQISIVIVMAVSNNVMVYYGAKSAYGSDIPLAAFGITMKVNQILVAVIMGMATGSQPIWGYNYGSRQYDRVKKAYKTVLCVSTIILILAFCVFQFAPMSIVGIFGSESGLYNEFAVKCFKIFLFACPLNGVQIVTSIFFQAIGKPKPATVMSLTRQIIFLIPATLILSYLIGVEGALWAGPTADTLAFILSLILLAVNWERIFAADEDVLKG